MRGRVYGASNVQLVHGGEDYFSTLEKLVNNAKHEIHLHTYIFDNDETGRRIGNVLMQAAKRGVKVFVLADAYGAKSLRVLMHELEQNGVSVRFFGGVYTGADWAWGRRLHHKIFVSDRTHALVGGINISNHYSGMGGEKAWLDYAVLVEGPVCKKIFEICKLVYAQWYTLSRVRFRFFEKVAKNNHPVRIQLMQNDWLRGSNQVARSYIKAIRAAKKEIIIANSYFLPGSLFRQALKNAVKRGVKVKIMLPGISDVPFIKKAIQYLYAYLFRHGIEIYEWNKGILHAKVACVDGEWATVGSYNLNFLSAYGSIEFNVNVIDAGFCTGFQKQLNHIIENECLKVEKTGFLVKRNIFRQFTLWLSYKLIKISEGLLITFPGQRIFNKNRYA